MGWIGWLGQMAESTFATVVEQTTHAVEDVSCKWLLIAMGSALMAVMTGGIAWIKSILKQLDDEKNARVNDLKEQILAMRRRRKDKEESDVA